MTALERAFYKVARENKLKEQKYRCKHCNGTLTRESATTDHIIPISQCGGRHSDLNFVVACKDCNEARGTMPIEEFTPPVEVLDDTDMMIRRIRERIEERVREAEWRLAMNPKGIFNKWKRFYGYV